MHGATNANSDKLSPHRAIESSSERGSMARKRYQKGQLWLEGEIWFGRWREDVLIDGVRKRVRVQKDIGTRRDYPTKRLAQRELDRQIEHVNDLSYRPLPTARFADFARKWEKDVLSQYGESTAINYRTHIRKHLVPFMGEYAMKDVKPELVQHFVSCSAVSPKTTRNICITLQSMWATAKAWRYVTHNVMEGVVLRIANGDSVSSPHNNKSNSSSRRQRSHTERFTDLQRKRAYGPVNSAA
jgi:hypothetical protein